MLELIWQLERVRTVCMFRNVYEVFLYVYMYVCMYVCIALVLASELNEDFFLMPMYSAMSS